MNFTAELTAFQGAIISADNVNRFSKITSRGGNEEKIQQIINSVYTFLNDKQYVTNEGAIVDSAEKQLRKFTFYLILNSDVPTLEQLQEAPGIDMIIWTIPILTKCLMCEFIWGLKLDPFVFDVIVYCNPKLSIEVLSPLIDSIKHFSPAESISKIKLLSYACYRLICRLHFYNYDSVFLTDLYEIFLRCITYFVTPPNSHKLDGLGDDDKYKFMGMRLLSFVNLINDCISYFKSVDQFEAKGFDPVFLCTMKPQFIEKVEFDQRICNIEDGTVSECLHKCNTALLDKCMAIMMDVSVDIFCAWSEFEENGRSMQSLVGEACYFLHWKLDRISSVFDHPLIEMLPQLSIKPKDVYDIMRVSDDDAVIENVDNDTENKEKWLKYVIEREDLIQKIDVFLDSLVENSAFIEDGNCKTLIKKLAICLENDPKEAYKILALDLFKQCEDTTREEILSNHFENKTFNDLFETKDLIKMINQVFNKFIVAQNANMNDVFNVFIQNPFNTYVKIINVAVENSHQCNLMLQIMTMLNKYSDHYYLSETEACIINCLQRYTQRNLHTDLQRNNFVHFLIELKKLGVISAVKLLLLIIMPNLDRVVTQVDYELVNIQIQLLDGAFDAEELVPYRTPVLAMLGQILEVLRWKLPTFSGKAPTVLEDTLKLQMKIFSSYNGNIPGKDFNWLKAKIRKLSPMNMYYYRIFWNPPGDNFIEIISGKKRMPAEKLVLFLTKALCVSTLREWSEAWDSLEYLGDLKCFNVFYDAYALMTVAESHHRTSSSRACLIYCLRNLITTTKSKFTSDPLTTSQVVVIMEKLISVMNLHKEEDIDEATVAVLPLFAHIQQKKEENYVIVGEELAKKIKYTRLATVITELFPKPP